MRIAIIREEVSFTKGGAERYAANLCNSLAGLGHEVCVLSAKFGSGLHESIRHVHITVNRLTSGSRTRSFHENAQKALVGLNADRVFALSRSFPADAFRVSDPIHRFWMRIRYPNAVNRWLQTLNPRHRTILKIEDAIFDPANTRVIVTNSELSKKIILENHAFPAERIHVVYNGVDLKTFSPVTKDAVSNSQESGATGPKLLFVGQDFKRKGLGALVRAMGQLKEAGVACQLRVIGRDRAEPYLELARSLGVAERIQFEGQSGKIQEAYRAADLLVFPSLYDPFANVCLEALACGLPVLTTTTNGSSEVVTEGVDGYVVDGAELGLAERITAKVSIFCAQGSEQLQSMRERARAKAERFTVEANAARIVEVLTATR
ncbi:MAG: glycosyltransferase family 4 protein [Rariglobus sp.]